MKENNKFFKKNNNIFLLVILSMIPKLSLHIPHGNEVDYDLGKTFL